MAAVDKLTPNDHRVQHKSYTIPSNPYNTTYHYLLAEPPSSTPTTGTALLVHGFPDLSFGWRYQVPLLLSLGLRVIVPDIAGFGRTDAPSDLHAYSLQRVVKDLLAIVRHVQGKAEGDDVEPIVLAGHDWGGAVVWRFALWHPEALRCVISLQWAGTEVDEALVGREKIRAFLKVLYGARRDDGKQVFNVAKGLDLEALEVDKIGESPLVNGEELEYYADEYARNGIKGPLSWYKTSKINFDEEKVLFDEGRDKITLPTLMVVALRDNALPPAMSANMHEYCTNLTKKEVNATHWALWEAAGETNQHFKDFLQGVLKEQPLKASI
ncbi:Alpha/Beta hydrolase protein [Dichotomopilus funicola]|uniref:Alpha/Beta hydrolase protein n=1 Tax=Dichotomopilus funicola TaxID=1934379 RepID=A0AAN6UWH0_9PEZI|nr:Alpha/Beta hydrolase protein [Dichotomopilus funicola]